MIRKVTSFAAMAAILSACQSTVDNTRYQTVQPAAKVSEAITLTPQGKKMQMLGTTPFHVSVSQGEWDVKHLAPKSECTLTSTAFNAVVKFDRTVQLPTFGKASPPIAMRCELGKKVFEQDVKAVNLTQAGYASEAALHATIGLGLVGMAITAGQASNRDQSKDLWGYPKQVVVGK